MMAISTELAERIFARYEETERLRLQVEELRTDLKEAEKARAESDRQFRALLGAIAELKLAGNGLPGGIVDAL